jgi:hypothetical protein
VRHADDTARGEDLRCAVWTEAQGVDPIGSAPRFDALLLVEWPLPWPKDVSEIDALAAAVGADPLTRVMTVLPQAGIDDGLVGVVHHRQGVGRGFTGIDHRAPRDEVPALLDRLLADVQGDSGALPTAVGEAGDDVLVCGHGRRDPCCGRWGTLLQVEAAARLPHLRVWRCSHTGGHRFAPTAITLAEGRAWAWADADLLAGITRRALPVDEVAYHDRGPVAVDPWVHPLDRALLQAQGWAWLDATVVRAGASVHDGGRSATVELAWRAADGDHAAQGEVVVTRDVPVLVCGEPPDAATKASQELALLAFAVDGVEHAVRGVPR